MILLKNFPKCFKRGELLKEHTTFKIGGPAQFWARPLNLDDLAGVLLWCKKNKKPFRVIGGGSNLLVYDKGVRGVVCELNTPFFTAVASRGVLVFAGAGASLSRLISFCTANKLSGVEFLTGIPGTLGGAIVGNAGTKDKSVGDLVEFVVVMDYNGSLRKVYGRDLIFSYRDSNIRDSVVLLACLKLLKKDGRAIKNSIASYAADRRRNQGRSWLSAGCVFKNPPGDSAGRLIDACGLKSARRGGAVVSETHANFILNSGEAKASDVAFLMRRAVTSVYKRYGIRLEPEIKIWR